MPASKKANLLQLTFLIYGAVCAGAFGLEDMVSSAGPGAALLTLLAMPFLFSLPVAYAVGELTAAFPVEGGNYRWSRMAFGDFWAFQAGWWAWMTGAILNSMFAVLFANYFAHWLPLTGFTHWLVCLGLIWAMHGLNLRGIQAVGETAIALSVVLLIPFVVLTALGVRHWHYNPFTPMVAPGKGLIGGFGSAVILGIWLYSGFDKLSAAAEEVENPSRNFPKALLAAAALTMLSYVLPTLAALAAQGDWHQWAGAYFPVAAQKIGGPWLGHAMLFGALCSNALLLNVTMLSASRLPFTLAQDGFLPKGLAKLHARFHTPGNSLLLGSLVYSWFALFDFTQLAVIYSWFQMASYILLYVNAWALRKSLPEAPRPFKIPGGQSGLLACLLITCALAGLAMLSAVFKNGTLDFAQAAAGALALLSGPAVYWACRKAAAAGLNTST